ncbi:MAG TPA: aspartyl/asparaginyl beta-hydroxylase domain-containing protein [Allosphingosinicella sp.]|nr:aspartyl/asparaginyl beta-hydroxylase domain-containing protein [Allosphingosinicella sp.]
MLSNEQAERLVREGVEALRQGRAAEARARFGQVAATGRASAQIWLLLATACRSTNDPEGEEAALDRLLSIDPKAVRGQIMKADCRLKAGDELAASRFYRSAMQIAAGQRVPPDLAGELSRAEQAVAEIDVRGDERREGFLTARGLPPGKRSRRFQQSLDISAGRKSIFLQEPTSYFFPELPQRQFYERDEFSWAGQVEAAGTAIREELAAVLGGGREGFRPYLHGDPDRPPVHGNRPLVDSSDWSALFLCENGALFESAVARCPLTWAAVQAAPLPRIAGSCPTVMFSLLRPGARIAPHSGMFNTRLICHLPLIVPPNCGFRVGNEVREWKEGELLIFDDTIEHEAWNESDQDRVVLIFDIWRPELTEQERQEVTALFLGPVAE